MKPGENPSDDLQPDLVDLHRSVMREPPDPDEGREPGPWWLWVAVLLTVFGGGFYLGRHGGAFFDDDVHVGYVGPGTMEQPRARPTKDSGGEGQSPIELGKTVYNANCAVCHQANGKGLPVAFPPLDGSEWVTGNEETLVKILLHGMTGPVEVAGATFNGVMPPWQTLLTDEQIAAVATYVRSAWANEADPVAVEVVARIRGETAGHGRAWTADELKAAEASP